MRKYFLELFAIGLVDSEGRINTEHMTSDALMTAMKTMEELTQMKMDRLVLETTMEMILCMFESCDTEEFTEIFCKETTIFLFCQQFLQCFQMSCHFRSLLSAKQLA